MTCNRNCDCVGECKAGNDKPATPTPTPGDLSARHLKVAVDAMHVCYMDHADVSVTTTLLEDMAKAAIAALSALPAAGGGCGDHDHADYIPGCPKCALTLPEKHTTPQPSVAEEGWGPSYKQPWQAQADAAVGAQGDEVVIGATRCYGDDNWFRELTARGVTFLVPLDQQDKARHALAAPAAGKGVDAWMTDDDRVISARQKETALRDGGASASSVAPYSIALTRQPVAGDGWRPIESAPREKLVLLANEHNGAVGCGHMDARGAWWWSHHPTHWQPLLAAPAATPTDGGER